MRIFLRIALTSIDQRSSEIGKLGAELALNVLESLPRRPKQVVLTPTFVERASTRRRVKRR